jgi:hypothetical protein
MGASNYNYNIPEPNSWESRSDNPADKIIDSLDATSVLHLAQRAAASQQEIAASEQFIKDEATFRQMYPAYKDSQHNAKLMKYHWENVLGTSIPTLEQIEDSFFTLRENGVLQLDPKQVAKENQEQILRRAAKLREAREAAEFNEADAYTMSLDELRARANREAGVQGW